MGKKDFLSDFNLERKGLIKEVEADLKCQFSCE